MIKYCWHSQWNNQWPLIIVCIKGIIPGGVHIRFISIESYTLAIRKPCTCNSKKFYIINALDILLLVWSYLCCDVYMFIHKQFLWFTHSLRYRALYTYFANGDISNGVLNVLCVFLCHQSVITLLIVCFLFYSMSEKHAILERVKVRDINPFSWRVFFTWDFSVTSRSGVITKHKVLVRELRVCCDVCADVWVNASFIYILCLFSFPCRYKYIYIYTCIHF